jgi:hypothetical protein
MLGVGGSGTSCVLQILKTEQIIDIQRGALLVRFRGVESALVFVQ